MAEGATKGEEIGRWEKTVKEQSEEGDAVGNNTGWWK